MEIKEKLLAFLENNLFLKNGTCPICGKVLFVTDSFLCRQCYDELPRINNPTCERCGRPVFRSNRKLCTVCTKENLPFAGGYACLRYEESGKSLVHAIKFKDRPHLGIWIGLQMGEVLAHKKWIEEIRFIVPVPLHPDRMEERGYNQSEKIAQGIIEGLHYTKNPDVAQGIELATKYLIRSRDTPHQLGQSREERLRNLIGAFDVNEIEDIQNKTIMLVDDVLTTGATLSEASATLLEAGAKKVFIATVCAVAE